MITLKDHKITYYGQVSEPTYKGLLSTNVDIAFEGVASNPLLVFKPNPRIIYKGVTEEFFHIVAQSQSVYELHTNGSISIPELYEVTKEALAFLRSFLQNVDISIEIKNFPDPPLEALQHSLEDILVAFHRK